MGWAGASVCYLAGMLLVFGFAIVAVNWDSGLSWQTVGGGAGILLSVIVFASTAIQAERESRPLRLTPEQALEFIKIMQGKES